MKLLLALCGLAAAVHEDRLVQIREIESTPGVLWKAGLNPRFASQAPGASRSLCGVKEGWKEQLRAAIARGEVQRFSGDANAEIPESFDSTEQWPQCAKTIDDILDQSNCGCCWAFAGVEAASDRMCIATNASILLPLSPQDVCFCASEDGCDGGMIDTPWTYIKSTGAVTGGQYRGTGPFGKGMCADYSLPHCHHHGPQGSDPYPAEGQQGCPHEESPKCPKSCSSQASQGHSDFAGDKYSFHGHVESAEGEAQIQRMILAGGPVETAFMVHSDFENYVSGIYHHVKGGLAGGHAVKMVGWGTENGVKYWKVANSWNPYWGEHGYFRIRRGSNEGGIEDMVAAASATATWAKRSDLPPVEAVIV